MADLVPDEYWNGLLSITNFSTTTASTASTALTYEGLKAAIDSLPHIPPEPLGEYMRERGCPPEEGWLLFLPASMRDDAGPFPPTYVRFSPAIREPVMLRDQHHQLRTFGQPAPYPHKPR